MHGKLAADPQHAAQVLGQVEQLTAASDALDQAHAKLHKAMIAVLDQADDTDIAPALPAQHPGIMENDGCFPNILLTDMDSSPTVRSV